MIGMGARVSRVLGWWTFILVASTLTGRPASAAHGSAGPVPLIPPAELRALLDAGQRPLLIDLRPAEAFRRGHLPGARSIPLAELRRRHVEIPRGRVILYCDCPREELDAAYRFLADHGAERVQALAEGFADWVGRGYPLER